MSDEQQKPEELETSHDEVMPTQNVDAGLEVFQPGYSSTTSDLLIVSFYLPGRNEPLIVNGAKTISIGRRDPKRRINPTIDLTEDHGAKLGVSRMHAEMNFVNGQYYLKDTGSSNGTWVNDTKLQPYQPHPVQSGDQIRIGQLAIVVHLSLPQRQSSSDVISTLIDDALDIKHRTYKINDHSGGIMVEDGGMVFSALRTISAYLEHVSRIHRILNEAQGQQKSTLAVIGIRLRVADMAVLLDVADGIDLMDFLAEKLPGFINVLEGDSGGVGKQTDSLQRYPGKMERIADYALQELVYKFMTDDERDDFVKRLVPHFEAIITTGLTLALTTS